MVALVIGISNNYIVVPRPQGDGWQWDFHAIVLGYHQKGSVHLIATLGKSPSLLSFGKAKQAWLSAHLIATLGKSPNESNLFAVSDVDAGTQVPYRAELAACKVEDRLLSAFCFLLQMCTTFYVKG